MVRLWQPVRRKLRVGSNNLVLLVRNSRAKVHLDLASPQRTSTSLSKHCHITSIPVCRLPLSVQSFCYNCRITVIRSSQAWADDFDYRTRRQTTTGRPDGSG